MTSYVHRVGVSLVGKGIGFATGEDSSASYS